MEQANKISALGLKFVSQIQADPGLPPRKIGTETQTLVTFSAPDSPDATVVVADDSEELTIYYADITHVHVGNYDKGISEAERNERIAAAALSQLQDFFGNRIEAKRVPSGIAFLGPPNGRSGVVFRWPNKSEFRGDAREEEMRPSAVVLATLAAAIWIALSEFFRNSILLHTLWEDHYKGLGLTFLNAPVNGMVWGLWSLAYAGCIVAVSRRFSLVETIALAWVFGFVLMWLVIGNLGVLPAGLLLYAVPLSLFEAAGAAWLARVIQRLG